LGAVSYATHLRVRQIPPNPTLTTCSKPSIRS